MKRKILYPVILIVVLVLGYLNYFKEEPGIKEVKETVETIDVSYETSGYFIDAKKQFDDLKTKDTIFEKATAKFKDMVLSGDNVLLTSAKNLFLKNNIIGKNGKEWEFFTEQLNYDNLQDTITSNSGIKVINKLQNVTIKSQNFKTNSKFNVITLNKNIEIRNKDTELFADNGNYVSETKIFTLNDNGKYLTKDKNGKELSGTFTKAKFNSNTKVLELLKKFTTKYEEATLSGTRMWYNEDTKIFVIPDNPVISLNGYKILSKEIRNPDGKDIVYIEGPVNGSNGEISFRADKGHYNTVDKKLFLNGDIVVTSKNGERITADKLIYDLNTKLADFIGKNDKVIYSFQDRKASATKVVYNTATRMFYLDKGYIYEDNVYKSHGEKLDYDFSIKKGIIYKGTLFVKNKNEMAKGDKIIFDTELRDYIIENNAELNNGKYLFKSEKLDYLNSKGFAHFLKPFEIINLEDKSVISGINGEYNIKTSEFKSLEKISYNNEKEKTKISGNDILYNLVTKKGQISKNVIYENKKDNILITGNECSFEKDKYLKIDKDLIIETDDKKISGDKGIYSIFERVIKIPGKINISSKDNKMNGIVYDGVYNVGKENLTASKLSMVTKNEETIKSDVVFYNTKNNHLELLGNIIITNKNINLKSNKINYNIKTEKADILAPFKLIYDKNFVINGDNGILDIKEEKISANDIEIISDKNEKFTSNKVFGNMKEMKFDFVENTKGKIYQLDKKSGKMVPVLYSGDFIRTYFKKDAKTYKVIRIEGRKNSVITRENEKFYSDYIEMDLIRNIFYAGKNNKIILNDEYGNTLIKGDNFVLKNEENLAEITGNVYIKNINTNGKITSLKGDRSIIDNKKNEVEVIGNVEIENDELILMADRVIYNKITSKVRAFGDVKVNYKEK